MIAHNESARGGAVRGPVKHGEALLAGLLRCGRCGAKLLAQYPGPRVIRYQCSGYLLNRDHACCVMFGGLRADRLVSKQLLQCLAPLGMEAAIEAIEALQGASDDRIQQKTLALEHARYEVTHARRQYDAVDPANRLVAAELERRWNQALTTKRSSKPNSRPCNEVASGQSQTHRNGNCWSSRGISLDSGRIHIVRRKTRSAASHRVEGDHCHVRG